MTNTEFTDQTESFTNFNPFQKFDFSNFETFDSIPSATKKFSSADNFFGDEAKTVEFFFSSFTEEDSDEFKRFFLTEIFPKMKESGFVKFNFFQDLNFNFKRFNEFFDQFTANGIFFETCFFNFPTDFNYSEFGFPFKFDNGNFKFSFSVNSQNFR